MQQQRPLVLNQHGVITAPQCAVHVAQPPLTLRNINYKKPSGSSSGFLPYHFLCPPRTLQVDIQTPQQLAALHHTFS